jgi:hypothetical protein
LNELFVLGNADRATSRTDDACGHCVFQAKGLTHRQHPVTNFQLVAVAERGCGKVVGLNADDRHFRRRIGLHFASHEFAPVIQTHRDLAASGHHVVIRQNDARWVNDDARPRAHARRLAHLFHFRNLLEEPPDRRIELL